MPLPFIWACEVETSKPDKMGGPRFSPSRSTIVSPCPSYHSRTEWAGVLDGSSAAYFLTASVFLSKEFYLDKVIVNKTNTGFV